MGGKYFGSAAQPLHVPRMSKNVYYTMKTRLIDTLKQHFREVGCPIEAPEKETFGDLDIAVHGFIDDHIRTETDLYGLLLKVVEPERMEADSSNLKSEGNLTWHAALPYPEDLLKEAIEAPDSQTEDKRPHIQLDIRVCKTAHDLRWDLFKHAHGDIWSMIGSTIRLYGLTVDEKAMYIRIPEIEKFDGKRARIVLTTDPDEILDFLGLDPKTYWEGKFPSDEKMFEYVAEGRLFHVVEGNEENDRKGLKANDRRRIDQRTGFARWMEEFVPACRESGRYVERTSRMAIKEEAFARFDVHADYMERLKFFLLERQRIKIWNEIKAMPPPAKFQGDHTYRGCSTQALKRAILEGDEEFTGGPLDLKNEDSFFIESTVRQFLEERGEEIGRKAYDKHHAAWVEKKGTGAGKRKNEGL